MISDRERYEYKVVTIDKLRGHHAAARVVGLDAQDPKFLFRFWYDWPHETSSRDARLSEHPDDRGLPEVLSRSREGARHEARGTYYWRELR